MTTTQKLLSAMLQLLQFRRLDLYDLVRETLIDVDMDQESREDLIGLDEMRKNVATAMDDNTLFIPVCTDDIPIMQSAIKLSNEELKYHNNRAISMQIKTGENNTNYSLCIIKLVTQMDPFTLGKMFGRLKQAIKQ